MKPYDQAPASAKDGLDSRHLLNWRLSIMRHWRGELSLPISFWAIGAFRAACAYVVNLLGWAILERTYEPYLIAACLFGIYGSDTALLVWWWVGAWRSANRRIGGNKAWSWPTAAMVVIYISIAVEVYSYATVVIPQVSDAVADAAGDPQWGSRGISIVRDGKVLKIYGSITRSVSRDLHKALLANPQIGIVELDSPGGRAGPALSIADEIRTRNLDTLVVRECSSACVISFLGGKHRWITADGRLGFHKFHFGGVAGTFGNQEIRSAMMKAGVTANFLDRAFATAPGSVWYPSFQELKTAGVVTGIYPVKEQ